MKEVDTLKIEILGYWGGYPSRGGATAGYLISAGESKVLLDCGSGVMSKFSLVGRVEDLSAVILSHLHYDHTADIGILQYAAVGALRKGRLKNKMSVFSPQEPKDMWEALQSEQTDFYTINETQTITIDDMVVEFLSVNHTIPCFAVKIKNEDKTIVYSADTTYIESLVYFAKNADLFICEATICEGSIHSTGKGHMNAIEAGILAKKANVKNLVLTHLPHDGDFELMKQQASNEFEKEVHIATELSVFEL